MTYNKPLNLFLSLPEELKRVVFDYEDSPYRDIYKTITFKEQLILKWWLYKKYNCIERVKGVLRGMFFSGVRNWENEFGRITNEEITGKWKYKPSYRSVDDIMIYLHPLERGIVKYKVLPKNATIDNCEFLQNSKIHKKYDGFLVRSDMELVWDTRETLNSIVYHILRNEQETFHMHGLYDFDTVPKQRTSFMNNNESDFILWTWL